VVVILLVLEDVEMDALVDVVEDARHVKVTAPVVVLKIAQVVVNLDVLVFAAAVAVEPVLVLVLARVVKAADRLVHLLVLITA
jgi:hypothetical protein